MIAALLLAAGAAPLVPSLSRDAASEVTQADVDAAVRAQAEKLDACFVALSPGAPRGGVKARVIFGRSGYVAALELMENSAAPSVGACVLAVLAQVKVPEGPEEFAVEVPIAVGPKMPQMPRRKK